MRKTLWCVCALAFLLGVAAPALADEAPSPDPAALLGLTSNDCEAPSTPAADVDAADDLLVELSDHGGSPFEDCNETRCGPGFYCCNVSCSICAPEGDSCITLQCE